MTAAEDRRTLRIAYPISSLRIGGAELRVLSLVERLPRDRFEVEFLSLIGEGPLDQRARTAGAHVHHIGRRALIRSPWPVKASGRAGKLARYLSLARRSRYDIIDAWLYPTDVMAALGRYVTKTPVVVAGRADLLPRQAFGPFSAKVDRIANQRVDAIVANSEAVAAANRGRDGADPAILTVIRNGVVPVAPISDPDRRALRSSLGAQEGDLLIGSVGMLSDVKRHALLIEAFAEVARVRTDVRLTIVGEGYMRPELERQVEYLGLASRIRLPGAVDDVRPLFDAFDVVALSSRSEGLPNALLEAATAGRPIVTTAAGGAVEIVIDGVTGLVVPVEDREALTGALFRTADDKDLRERLGSAARRHVAASFGMDRFVQAWCDLYERLAVSKGVFAHRRL